MPVRDEDKRGGGSDDIGDISWNVPTVTLRYPSNIPGLPGHNWSSAIAMATPIAHKGVVAGAKVQAMTILDFVMKPELVKQAWDYFTNVQTKDQKYIPFIAKDTPPPTWLNKAILDKYRPEMKKYYYDPSKYPTYLDQLGIKYPTVRTARRPSRQEQVAAREQRHEGTSTIHRALRDPSCSSMALVTVKGWSFDIAPSAASSRSISSGVL